MHWMVLLGALIAAPLFSQSISKNEVAWLLKLENREQVFQTLGAPGMVADYGADFRSWHYRDASVEHDDFSHVVVIRRSTGALVSLTHNFDPQVNVDALFPSAETTVCRFTAPNQPPFSVRVRRLSAGRLLLAIGTSAPGETTGQLVWMRESELRSFYPWVADQLGTTMQVNERLR